MKRLFGLLILILGFASAAHGQLLIRYQNSTTTLGQVAGGVTTIKCDGSTITCTFSGGVFTLTSTGSAPSGNAGGDLSGTYPNPTVAKINGTAFSGTNGHLVSFGAANIPADSGVVAANAVVASSPGAGLCHFAGSTQTCTSSAVVGSDMTNNTVTSTQLAVVNTRRVCDIPVGDASGSAITNGQLGPQKHMCYIPFAATIVEMDVEADGGTPNVIVGVNHAGSVSNIVSTALATASSGGVACSKTTAVTGLNGATTCSATLQNTSIAIGDYLELVSGTAGGTAKLMTIHIIYLVN